MHRDTRRYLILLAILAVGAGLAWVAQGHLVREVPLDPGAADGARYTMHSDVAGWYAITADEAVLVSPYDLRLSGVVEALPWTLGPWAGRDLGPSDEIVVWYDEPELVIRRRYDDANGHLVWLTVIASRGPKSFRLFEHTPHICYAGSEWQTLIDDVVSVPLARGAFAVRRGAFARDGERHLVYAWYQWDGPARDPAQGVASWRLSTEMLEGEEALSDAEARLTAFARLLWSETVPWRRF